MWIRIEIYKEFGYGREDGDGNLRADSLGYKEILSLCDTCPSVYVIQ